MTGDTSRGGSALEIRGLRKEYGHSIAIHDLDLVVPHGEFLTLLGPSGSGKSTVLRTVAGFIEPTRGSLLLDGIDASRLSPRNRNIGMVVQNYALFPHLTAAENIDYGLKMRGVALADRRARVAEMLDLVGLADLGKRKPRQLSGGQQQRVALARALAYQPAVLLMDEPLGALDRDLRMRMAEEIRELHTKIRSTVLYVTHDRDEAMSLSDRIVIMRDGRIEADGRPRDLYRQPPTRFTARFFSSHNVVPATVREPADDGGRGRAEYLGQSLRVAGEPGGTPGSNAGLTFLPSAVRLTATGDALAIKGTVSASVFMGEFVRVKFRPRGVAESMELEAQLSIDHAEDLLRSEECEFFVPVDDLWLIPEGPGATASQS